MKQRLQKIAFYYFVFASLAAYLFTVISLLANQNWHEYFISPAYLFCQLLAAGWILGMPIEIILSVLPLAFICIGFVLYLKKSRYSSMFTKPVLMANIVVIAISGVALVVAILTGNAPGSSDLLSGLDSIVFAVVLCFCLYGGGENEESKIGNEP